MDHNTCYMTRVLVKSKITLLSKVVCPNVAQIVSRIYYNREGAYFTLWACVTTLYGVHDLCNDIHMLEASVLAVCGHVAKLQVG